MTTPDLAATVHVVVAGGARRVYLTHGCLLPFVPTVGMSLVIGSLQGTKEDLVVDAVEYDLELRALTIHCRAPDGEHGDAYVERLKAAGFRFMWDLEVAPPAAGQLSPCNA